MIAGIELGGTRIRCAVSLGGADLIAEEQFATSEPLADVNRIVGFIRACEANFRPLTALGVATFGPVDLRPSSPTYGSILSTPKAGWSNFPLLKTLRLGLDIPISITTDVNGALLAEHSLGAAKDVDNAVYVTVGTGIGAGIMVNGKLVTGFLHPEVGHMIVPNDGFKGVCPYHGNCLEGLASGPAIAARAGQAAESLNADDSIWTSIAGNLADMCQNLLVTLATERIVMGGGVMQKAGLLEKIKEQLEQKLQNYLPLTREDIDRTIVAAEVAEGSGLMGAILMAKLIANNN